MVNQKAFYAIQSVESSPEEDGTWEVIFFVSGDKDDVDTKSPMPTQELREWLASAVGSSDVFEFEVYKNAHLARLGSEEEAKAFAHQLVRAFGLAGFEAMTDSDPAYKAPVQAKMPSRRKPSPNP